MPNYGEKQMPAGVEISTKSRCGCIGTRTMMSNNSTIIPSMTIHNTPYKGNVNLLANE